MNRTVKKVQETAPFIKDSRFILLLCQLIVNVLKLNGLRVVIIRHTTDSIWEHPLKWDGLLSSLRDSVLQLGTFHNCLNLSLLFSA